MGAVRDAAAFVFVFVRDTEAALVEAGGEYDGTRGVLLAVVAVSTVQGPVPERAVTSPKPISTPATVASSVRREAMSGPVQISSKSCSSPRLISTPPGASLSRQRP